MRLQPFLCVGGTPPCQAGLEGTVELATNSGGGALRTYQVDVADGARVAEVGPRL